MHMADALVSPAVGGALWAASAGLIAYSAAKVKQQANDPRVPLMGIVGAFVFSAQMVNFAIPGTGSSGHLGGGLLLAILLGPHGAFLAITSVLAVQALFFADGGLLALGCNVFNLGFFPCFVAYPYVYRVIVGARPSKGRILAGSVVAAVASLQFGAAGVVVETVCSGVSELPFMTFALMMLPLHLAIGLVEGFVTSLVVGTVWKARPEILEAAAGPVRGVSVRAVAGALGLATLLTAGGLSWFASTHPDGLEWSVARVSGQESAVMPKSTVHSAAGLVQKATAYMPDYEMSAGNKSKASTSVAGIVGSVLTLVAVGTLGFFLTRVPLRSGEPHAESRSRAL